MSVYRRNRLNPSNGLGSTLGRFAVGPLHWHMIVFDFNHVEHPLDDIDDPKDETGILYRELVVEVKTTDIDLYKELLIKYAENEHTFGGGKNHLDFPC